MSGNGPFGAIVLRQIVNITPQKAGETAEEFLGEIAEGYSETSEAFVVRFDDASEITIAPDGRVYREGKLLK